MAYTVEVTSYFARQAKRLLKKYPTLKSELATLIHSLEVNPELGTPLGNQCYKIRLAIASKGKGKSGGARVINHIDIIHTKVYLLCIYDKSEQENITNKELKELLSLIP
jgi:hypothetical protein